MTRHPCEHCGGPLYFHEQAQRWCRPCAGVLGVTRICDRPSRAITVADLLRALDDRGWPAPQWPLCEVASRWFPYGYDIEGE
jgi:hypothetical protein